MEVIRINRERIKIMLSPTDMEEMNINCDMLEVLDKDGKEAFSKIMQEARNKCGFISCGRKIYVQVFPSKDGGCEMFITKINDGEISDRLSKRKKYYYKFRCFEDLMKFCQAMMSLNYNCSAYKDIEKENYYITSEEKCDIYGEFGGKECSELCSVYITERCRLICEDAVNQLGRFA